MKCTKLFVSLICLSLFLIVACSPISYGIFRGASLTHFDQKVASACIMNTLKKIPEISDVKETKNEVQYGDSSSPLYTYQNFCFDYKGFSQCVNITTTDDKGNVDYYYDNDILIDLPSSSILDKQQDQVNKARLQTVSPILPIIDAKISEQCNMPELKEIKQTCNVDYPVAGCP